MKAVIFGILLCLLLIAATAENLPLTGFEGQEIPAPFDTILGDQRLNINVDSATVGVVIVGKKINSIQNSAVGDPTITITTTKAVVTRILLSSNSGREAKKALEQGEITYSAVGIINKIKFKFIGFFLRSIPEEETTLRTVTVEDCASDPLLQVLLDDCVALLNVPEEVEPVAEVEAEETAPVENGPKTHVVEITNAGFVPDKLTIAIGDTVVWKNVRTGTLKKAFIVGSQLCMKVRSAIFLPGQQFQWTFSEKVSCPIVDGIDTLKTMKLKVE